MVFIIHHFSRKHVGWDSYSSLGIKGRHCGAEVAMYETWDMFVRGGGQWWHVPHQTSVCVCVH